MTQNAPNTDAQTFVEHLVRSGLMDSDAMTRLAADGPTTHDGHEVARFLVRTGMLTKFQADRLLAGRGAGLQLGQYRLMEELGRGGMGRVYKAMHQTMGRVVALKLLSPTMTKTETARDLFRREVRAAAKLNHPNIVAAFDANQAGDACFLVMELVAGPTLQQLVKDRGPLPAVQVCEFMRQAAAGLAYAHEQGLIHRDIKPANLLVQSTAAGPVVKILDFGLAHMVAPESASDKSDADAEYTMHGTPDFISPEQARNKSSVDARSDLYSLGCTFYKLLTGTVPFPGGSTLEKIVRHYSDDPTDVRQLRPDVPDALAAVVHKLLAKKAEDRYQTADELVASLHGLAAQHADWHPPSTAFAQRVKETQAGTEDPWANLADDSMVNTLPNVTLATRETATARPIRVPAPIRDAREINWVWLSILMGCVLSVSFGVVFALRFLVTRQ